MPLTTKKTDREVQVDVLLELRWDSRVSETEVGVEVDHGVVTLTGTVDNYSKKLAANEVAHRVVGVVDVADNVAVKLTGTAKRTDTQIAQAVRFALEWDAFLPGQRIRSTVLDGAVTLEGEVPTLRDKVEAERIVQNLPGVAFVANRMTVAPVKADPVSLRKSIEEALERRAEREANAIRVMVEGGAVTLEGRVRTWPEKRAALGAVSHAPGVREVRDRLSVNPWNRGDEAKGLKSPTGSRKQ